MRILGVDPGEKRIGLAVSDPLGLTASGLKIISGQNHQAAAKEIAALCHELGVEKIVVGNPLNMDGTKGPASVQAEAFASRLKKITGLPVYLFDERLTSSRAEKMLIGGGLTRKKRRLVKDKIAAALILESFMATHQNSLNQE